MLKYTPRTGAWGETDLCQVTLTPAADPDNHIEQRQKGVGTVRFHKADWSDLPTMHHVVNALAALARHRSARWRGSRSRVGGSPTATSACSCSAACADQLESDYPQLYLQPDRVGRAARGPRRP